MKYNRLLFHKLYLFLINIGQREQMSVTVKNERI